MNSQEDAGMELAKEGVKDLLSPVVDIMRDLLGPSAREIGLSWGDSFRVWRLKRIVRLLEEVKQVACNAGLRIEPVAPRVLFPLLEAASLEEEDDLYCRWVALLSNTASHNTEILPCFPDLLRQLSPPEAQFLDKAYDETFLDVEKRRADILQNNPDFKGDVGFMGISGRLLSTVQPVLIGNLERLGLVTRMQLKLSLDNQIQNIFPPANHLYVSELGKTFIRACRIPMAEG